MPDTNPTGHGSSDSNRKLYAILFADIQGYTAMMQADEDKALSRLSRYQNTLESSVKSCNGQIVKNYGDGSLCLFENTIDAAKCAVAIQEELMREPNVPLRIGLHLGDVTFREGDIYGNDINLASRIESMGISGSVLMSAEFWRKVKAKSSYSASSLGFFQFKNVEDRMEVFALNHGDIAVPSKSELSGKLEPNGKTSKLGWIIGGLLLAALLIYGGLSQWGILGTKNDEISEVNREKRLTVLDFENQTSNADLDAYGSMFADWISRGLINVDKANIIKASNLGSLLNEDGLGSGANPEFAKATGIDLVVDGRYYYIENKLIAIANLVDIASGEIVKSFQKEGTQPEAMTLLNALTQEIVGYWAVRENSQLAEDPPTYEAYVEYLDGMRLYTVNAADAATRFETAFALDSTFYPPLFRLYGVYHNMSDFDRAEDVLQYLSSRKSEFTNFNRIQYEAIVANHEKNYLQSAEIQLQLTEIDPSDNRANRNAAYTFYLSNRPQRAIEVLQNFDSAFILTDSNPFWRKELEAVCNYSLHNYNRTIEIANSYDQPRASILLTFVHLQSLVRLKKFDELAEVFATYMERGVYTPIGTQVDEGQLLVFLCTELKIDGEVEELEKYLGRLNIWLRTNELNDSHDLPDLFNNSPFRQREIEGYTYFLKDSIARALEVWNSEEIPESNWPDRIERISRLGVCHAMLGDTTEAMRQIDRAISYDIDHSYSDLTKQYYTARVWAALGEKAKSTEQIKGALDDGMVILRPQVLKTDPFLIDLIAYEPYEDLIAPKD